MKNKKTIVIATFLLGSLLHSPFILSLSTDAEQILNSEDIITEPISSDEIQETASTAEQEKEAAKIQSWDNHLDALKEKDQYWDKNSNTPTNDWKEEAFRLAKEDLDKDTTIA
ncbi:MAG TPA: hypothetical protein VHX42_05305, partial [Candidatus Babeliales bacterium]|nr:hypothetical protein [Candidatus Babeliales bacterium]